MRFKQAILFATCTALAAISLPAAAQPFGDYEISITNISEAQAFTPFLAATHAPSLRMFTPGEAASDELADLAEGGATDPLADLLWSFPGQVRDIVQTEGLLMPGETMTFEITADVFNRRLSFAAMLIPTNDSFVGLNALPLPAREVEVYVPAYDAGSEPNDELCANIPGPVCGGAGGSPLEGGEGFVHISQGIQGIGDLAPETYDWRNPVAYVVIRRMRR